MDFVQLLGLAQKNQDTPFSKNGTRFASTKVSAPKKNPREKKLSENVKKFLEKSKQEEEKKRTEEQLKKKKLLEMRSENKRSVRTMNSMLQRTKSSNKAAIAEAKNNVDTADTLAGRFQCDEDDYGYESKTANALYEKLMNKYESNPEDPMKKFAKIKPKTAKDANSTVARVKSALDKEEEDANAPRKRSSHKSSSSSSSHDNRSTSDPGGGGSSKHREAHVKKPSKPKVQAPAGPSFHELLKIAQEKSKQPVEISKKSLKKDYEFGDRPMTTKEKEEFMREHKSQLRKSGKLPPAAAPMAKPDEKKSTESPKTKGKEKPAPAPAPPVKKKPVIEGPEFHPAVVKAKPPPSKRPVDKGSSRPGPASSKHPKPSSSRQPEDRKRKRPVSRSPSPIRVSSSKKAKNAMRIDSESEYDSEMDDFIDDTEANVDISAEIRNLFGYDRRKFADEDDFDDRSMECNRFSALMKEEARSARIGKMEDLEDMRREEEEKKRKKMKMKKR